MWPVGTVSRYCACEPLSGESFLLGRDESITVHDYRSPGQMPPGRAPASRIQLLASRRVGRRAEVVSVGSYRAIGDVGRTLVDLLEERMSRISRGDVALASPNAQGEGGNDWRLTLYLYDVSESDELRNVERRQPDPGADAVPDPPLVLDLQYLLTAHPGNGASGGTKDTAEQHEVLGQAMQVLRDNAILRGSDLTGSVAGADRLRISIRQESIEAVMNVWNTFDQPYQPSVAYLVTPVTIESTRETAVRPVVEREAVEHDASTGVGDGE